MIYPPYRNLVHWNRMLMTRNCFYPFTLKILLMWLHRLMMIGKELASVPSVKDLGLFVDSTLSFDEHITITVSSCMASLVQINRVKHLLDVKTLENVINALVFSKLFYCCTVWSGTSKKNVKKLQRVQSFALRLVTKASKYDHITPLLHQLQWLPVK